MRYLSSLLILFFFQISVSQTTQIFNSSGSFTVPAGVFSLKVDAWGAGGAGGILTNGAKGGGGGGAYTSAVVTVMPGATYTVTVGTGGVPTSSLAPAGGNSSFGSLVIAAGGTGASGATGGAGGQASSCTPSLGAISGTNGVSTVTNAGGAGGAGANGGAGGTGGAANNGDASSGIQPGGGGGGKAGPGGGALSGSGGDGRVIVSYTSCSAPTISCAANVTVNAVAPACNATTSLTSPTISNVCYRNHSLDFDGTNDYVSLPSGLTSTFNNFTFEAWVYWDGPSTSTWQRIMDFGSNTNVNMFLTPRSDSGTPRFAITTTGGGGEQRLTSPSALSTGQWHHFAVVLDDASNTGWMYINGLLVAQNTGITLTPASLGTLTNNWIGRSQYADPFFNGKIDEVRIWNTTRTQSQIQANMNSEFSTMPSGLIAYYKFNSGISCCSNAGLTTLTNESGSNNGTLQSFSLATGCTSNWAEGATPIGNPLTLSNNFNSSCSVTSASFPTGTSNVTWLVTDGYGNTSTCVQTVTVNETQVPSITCPANIATNAASGSCSQTVSFTTPIGTDNCPSPVTTQTAGLPSGSSYPTGVTTNTFRVTDAAGNTATCSFTVTVTENQLPVITCPANIAANVASGSCGQTVSFTSPVGTDNCPSPVTIQTAGLASGSSYPVGVTTNTFRVTDASGNTATCSFTITVTDNQLPTITCPANIGTNVASGTCAQTVNFVNPVGSDNCPSVITIQTTGLASGASYPVGITTNTFRVTDASGNTATCSFTVTITDNEPPTIIDCPSDFSVGLSSDPLNDCMTIGNWNPPLAMDNCPGTILYFSNYGPLDLLLLGDNMIEYEIIDAAGNINTLCTFTVSVFDDNAPVVISCPLDVTINTSSDAPGNCSAVYSWVEPVVIDDCDGPLLPINQSHFSGAAFNKGTTQVLYEYMDNESNMTNCEFTITVVDDELPVISCPANISTGTSVGQCSAVVNFLRMDGTDNCPGAFTGQIAGFGSGSAYPLGITTNIFRVTDDAGNTATCSFNITVVDNILPAINCPSDIIVDAALGDCAQIVNYTAPMGTDNCASPVTIQLTGLVSGSSYPVGTTSHTFRVTDGAGNTASCSFNIIVNDIQDPEINCPANILVDTDPGFCTAIVNYATPAGTDNCPGSSTALISGLPSGSAFANQVTTVVYQVTDAAGNTATCGFTIAVVDTESPVALCQNLTTYLDGTGMVSIMGSQVNNGSSDACGIGSINVSPSTFTCANVGINNVVLTVTDVNGNAATCAATVNVQDTIRPLAVCQNITSYLNAGGTSVITGPQVNNGSSDACGIATISVSPSNFTCANVGSNNVVLAVTDVNGNAAICAATVNVQDTIRPVAQCQNITSYLNAVGTSVITGPQVNNGSSDACGIATISVSPSNFTCANVGSNNVVLTVTDVNGNAATCAATVNVQDTIRPVAQCQNITSYLNAGGTSVITGTQVNNGSSDACGIATISVSPSNFTCANVGSNNVVLTVTDVNGNAATCAATVNVQDTIRPLAVCQNITSYLNVMGTSVITGPQVNNGSSDACGIATISVSPSNFTCANVGSNNVVLTVTDVNGNAATCAATVNVQDTIRPVAQCQNITSYLNAVGTSVITGPQVNNGSSDACGIATISVSPSNFTCANVGSNNVVLTVTDVNGNAATCAATVNVQDTIRPVAQCQNITSYLNAGGASVITGTQVNNGSSDACGIAIISVSPSNFTCANVGSNNVVLTVTDVNGNAATCAATVNVQDTIRPVAQCQNITSYLNAVGTSVITGPQVNNGSSDACGIGTISLSPSNFTCANVGINNVVLTVTDVNGNAATCAATVNVQDTIRPVAQCQYITSYLNAGGTSVITGPQVNNGSSDACGLATISVSPSSFTCANVGSNNVVLTVTDVNGNAATCAATVNVQDTIRPVAQCQNITSYLNAGGTSVITGTQVNNGSSDACGIAIISVSPSNFTCANVGINNVVLTVTDVNGNAATCAATVNVQDTIRPVAHCQNITSYLNVMGTSVITGPQVNNGSSDACGIATISVSSSNFTCANVGSNNVVLTVTDVNGNAATCAATVNVQDTIRPVAQCQNITSYLNAGGTSVITGPQVNNGSSDACGIATISVSPSNFTCANVGSNNVVLAVTDVNGNAAICAATVNVQDTIRPVAQCQNITSYLNAVGTSVITGPQVNNGSSDACGIATISVSPSNFTCANVGSNNVVLTVTDVNGNAATCAATLSVLDTIPPAVPVLNDVTVGECDGTPSAPMATDVCAGSITGTTSTVFPITQQGTTVVTWRFDDGNGNVVTANQNIIVDDVTPPMVPVLPVLSSDCLLPITVTTPQAIDNCVGLVSGTTTDPLYYSIVGNYTINWTFNDGHGNISTTTQDVVISNAGAPVELNGMCYPSINAALSSGVNLGDVIHAYGNNLIESFEIPHGVTLEIHAGAVVVNSGMICNNGTILLSGGTYQNNGVYGGQGMFNGNFINGLGGVVKPGPCGN